MDNILLRMLIFKTGIFLNASANTSSSFNLSLHIPSIYRRRVAREDDRCRFSVHWVKVTVGDGAGAMVCGAAGAKTAESASRVQPSRLLPRPRPFTHSN